MSTTGQAMAVQAQIRANAEEMQDYLRDLNRWEKDMTKKDHEIKRKSHPCQVRLHLMTH